MRAPAQAVTVGVDVGTTSVKALAVNEDGKVIARSRVPHSVMAPEPTSCATTPSGRGASGRARPSGR